MRRRHTHPIHHTPCWHHQPHPASAHPVCVHTMCWCHWHISSNVTCTPTMETPLELQKELAALEARSMASLAEPEDDGFIADYFTDPAYHLHTITCAGELLGFAVSDPASGHLHELHAKYFRCGIGRTLLLAVEAFMQAWDANARTVTVRVHAVNGRARLFYEANGFRMEEGAPASRAW